MRVGEINFKGRTQFLRPFLMCRMEDNSRNKILVRTSWISTIGNTVLSLAKIVVGFLAGSLAVLGDGVDSATDVIISVVMIFAAKIVSKPPTKKYAYGYEKAETIATKILSLVIFYAGVQMLVSSIGSLMSPEPKQMPAAIAIYVTLFSIFGKLLLALYQYRQGKKVNSSLLTANAVNMRNDVIISAGVLVGLVFTFVLKMPILDTVTGLIISLFIIKSAADIFMESNVELMDGVKDEAVYAKIFDAAVETYRQNTFTIFMDCPSRERAGWLCDSFFTARVEKILTGNSEIEHNFLENFFLPDSFRCLPKGMFPMCYPGDQVDGNFIPNWAMWLVIELEEHLERTGDRAFVDAAKPRIDALLEYFKPFENQDGLLEKLKKWVFVEWSKSNELVQDINYPTNMLYAKMLRCAANLYGDNSLREKADRIARAINEQSYLENGFYCDNAVYDETGKAVLSGKCTESCQYYAFFCEIATPESRPELWRRLLHDFGPYRVKKGAWPNFNEDAKWQDIYPSNAFIGNYLRLELLYRYGEYEKLTENIKGYFLKMAELTGTLWENDIPTASCNHGFASHVIYWMNGMGMVE